MIEKIIMIYLGIISGLIMLIIFLSYLALRKWKNESDDNFKKGN